jgi:hypothetical protein
MLVLIEIECFRIKALPNSNIGLKGFLSDPGRIYIKGYLYPISYPKIGKKDIPLSFFLSGIC